MRTVNYAFAVVCIVLGLALVLFAATQTLEWNIGSGIGLLLILNGAARLWFAQDDS
jgi:preprotein translocase subunit SecY